MRFEEAQEGWNAGRLTQAQRRIGNGADAHLQRGAVRDHRGNVSGDPVRELRDRPHRGLGQFIIDRHDVGDLGNVDERIPQRARHVRVHFSDHDACRLCGGLGNAHFDTERTEAVFVRRADVDQRRIERELPDSKARAQMVRDVLRNLGQPKVEMTPN